MGTEIIGLERKYWQGMEDHDYEMVKNLTQFPCILSSKNGTQSVDEPSFKKMFESGDRHKLKVVNISNIESRLVTENVAVIAYVVELEALDEPKTPSMKCACSSTWTKQDEKWVCAHHTEAELAKQ